MTAMQVMEEDEYCRTSLKKVKTVTKMTKVPSGWKE